ncbi:MAG: hypothetical protein QG650_520 [Patescibacteria group bacterium]|nr:hypothetical protein [Patescibacteria group bacterium]
MDELVETYLVFFERNDFPASFQEIGDLGRFRSGGRARVENPGSFFQVEESRGNEAREALDVDFSGIIGIEAL